MKTIPYRLNATLDWVEDFAKTMEATIEGQLVTLSTDQMKGVCYFSQINPQVSSMIMDIKYDQTVNFALRNNDASFLGLYFNITDIELDFLIDGIPQSSGKWKYRFSIFDGSLDSDFAIKKDSSVYTLCIFIKKNFLINYLDKMAAYKPGIKDFFDPRKNTITRIDHISEDSLSRILELRRIPYDAPFYEYIYKSTVYALIGDCIDQFSHGNAPVVSKMSSEDVYRINITMEQLLQLLYQDFPGIEPLAKTACMSPTKYKMLFKKITGLSVKSFFIKNKIELAKNLLETENTDVNELSSRLNYHSVSYFIKRFKEYYGMTPKEFVKQLHSV